MDEFLEKPEIIMQLWPLMRCADFLNGLLKLGNHCFYVNDFKHMLTDPSHFPILHGVATLRDIAHIYYTNSSR